MGILMWNAVLHGDSLCRYVEKSALKDPSERSIDLHASVSQLVVSI